MFSILICSLHRRQQLLDRLLECLRPQIPLDEAEIIVHQDNGELTIGAKRNALLHKAKGKFIAFVDDDDLVSDDYVTLILEKIYCNPGIDVIGISLIQADNVKPNHRIPTTFHSLKYTSWWDRTDERGKRFYYRNPNHLNPVLRELALKVGFPDSSQGEDRDYSTRLLPLLKTEVYISEPIYYYLVRWPKDC